MTFDYYIGVIYETRNMFAESGRSYRMLHNFSRNNLSLDGAGKFSEISSAERLSSSCMAFLWYTSMDECAAIHPHNINTLFLLRVSLTTPHLFIWTTNHDTSLTSKRSHIVTVSTASRHGSKSCELLTKWLQLFNYKLPGVKNEKFPSRQSVRIIGYQVTTSKIWDGRCV